MALPLARSVCWAEARYFRPWCRYPGRADRCGTAGRRGAVEVLTIVVDRTVRRTAIGGLFSPKEALSLLWSSRHAKFAATQGPFPDSPTTLTSSNRGGGFWMWRRNVDLVVQSGLKPHEAAHGGLGAQSARPSEVGRISQSLRDSSIIRVSHVAPPRTVSGLPNCIMG